MTKKKMEDENKLFDEEIKKTREAHNERIKKINQNKNIKTKGLEIKISELEKEKTFLIGSLSILKANNEITDEEFASILAKVKTN